MTAELIDAPEIFPGFEDRPQAPIWIAITPEAKLVFYGLSEEDQFRFQQGMGNAIATYASSVLSNITNPPPPRPMVAQRQDPPHLRCVWGFEYVPGSEMGFRLTIIVCMDNESDDLIEATFSNMINANIEIVERSKLN